MSDHEWEKGPLFDPPHVRMESEQQIRIERPADIDVRQVTAPVVPGQHQAIPVDPALALQVWQQLDPVAAAHDATSATHAQSDAQTVVQLGLALYLLQAVHAEEKPGYEHLVRDAESRPDDDESEPA
jgi:hypothetical protein